MSNPIDSGSGVGGLQSAAETGAAQEAGSVEEAADAFRTEVEGASQAAESSPVNSLAMEVATKMHAGQLDPHQACVELLESMAELRFSMLEPNARRALAVDVRTSLMADGFFVMEVEELLGAALERIG